jgi:hypothetical protein
MTRSLQGRPSHRRVPGRRWSPRMRACVEGRIGTAWALRLNELVAIDDEESLTGVGLSILRGKAPRHYCIRWRRYLEVSK